MSHDYSELTTILRIMGMPRCVAAADAIAALVAERDAAVADAERYRAGFKAAFWFMGDPKRLKLTRDYSPMTADMFSAIDAAKGAP